MHSMRTPIAVAILAFLTTFSPIELPAEEAGANDFRISDMGPNGNTFFEGRNPAGAYNPATQEYLVAWGGRDDQEGQAPGETEIFSQRVDASSGTEVGLNDRRISGIGGIGHSQGFGFSFQPDVAFNPVHDEFLVVFVGVLDGVYGVYGQRLDGTSAEEKGFDDYLIADGFTIVGSPVVAYNPVDDEYLVAWEGRGAAPLVAGEGEIFVRLLDGVTGQPLGPTRRISEMGGLGVSGFPATNAAVAFDPDLASYLVIWEGTDDRNGVAADAEIYGQLIDGGTGLEIGPDDAQMSHMGTLTGGTKPSVAYRSTGGNAGKFFVVWHAHAGQTGARQVFGQGIDPLTGLPESTVDSSISQAFPLSGVDPTVTYDPGDDVFLVAWVDEELIGGDVDHEILGRLVSPDGSLRGQQFRISDAGSLGDPAFDALRPHAVAAGNGRFLVTWDGDDDAPPLVDDELEIFGQCLITPLFADGFESGDLSRWSAVVQ